MKSKVETDLSAIGKTLGLDLPLPKPESLEAWMRLWLLPSPPLHVLLCIVCQKVREADVEDTCHLASKSPSSFEYPDLLLGQVAIMCHLGGWAIPGESPLLLPATVNI